MKITTGKPAMLKNEPDYDALLDELPDPTDEELDTALDELFDRIHLSAPVTAKIEEIPEDE